jgi:hypothetical protein
MAASQINNRQAPKTERDLVHMHTVIRTLWASTSVIAPSARGDIGLRPAERKCRRNHTRVRASLSPYIAQQRRAPVNWNRSALASAVGGKRCGPSYRYPAFPL